MVVRIFKKILVGYFGAAIILGVILGLAGFFVLWNFDADKYRHEFEQELTQQTGFLVELGSVRLSWRPAPELQISGLKVFHPQSLEKLLQSDLVLIDIDLSSVWRKRFGASRGVIQRPEIFLKRDRRGVWNWQAGDSPAVSPVAGAPMLSQWRLIPVAEAAEGPGIILEKSLDSVTHGWKFGVGKILVHDATVHMADETVEPAFELDVTHLEAEVRQKTYASLFHFNAAGHVFNSEKLNLETQGDMDLASKSLDLTLGYGPGKVTFKGRLKVIHSMPHFEGALEIRDLDVAPLIPAAYKTGEYISGRLSTQAQVSLDGANPAIIKRSLAGQGTSGIMDGALRNRNVIKEVFDRLSPVLAVTNALGGQLPPELNQMLKGRDTPFQSLQVSYAVEAGGVRVQSFQLIHPNYQLSGKGIYGILDQRVNGSMELLLSKTISAYMIQKIRELSMIADRSGQIMIPFRYGGVVPDAVVQPDLPYIAAKMLQGGADQFLSQGLEKLNKILGSQKTEQTPVAGSAASQGLVAATGVSPTAKPTSKKKAAWIQEGLNILNQMQEPKKQ